MKKWLNWIAIVVVFAVGCGFLSKWQFDRRAQKLASIALVQSNFLSHPVPISDLLLNGAFSFPGDTWRPVELTGHYLPDKAQLVRNRPNDGNPGFEELVPFLTESGQVIFVSRGWLPSGESQDYPDEVPLPNSNFTSIVGRVLASEPTLGRTAPKGQLPTMNLELAKKVTSLPEAVDSGYLRLASESPAAGKQLKAMPNPSTEEGNNLSYAMQWILFALMAAAALIWRIRKDTDEARGIIRTRKVRRSDLDAKFEDETTRAK